MSTGLSAQQLKALTFSAVPFTARPRNISIATVTWEALYKKGLVSRPPWRITERGRLILEELNPLPYVPPLKSAHSCRVCHSWFEGDWSRATTDRERAEIQRQMDVGRCDNCTRKIAVEGA